MIKLKRQNPVLPYVRGGGGVGGGESEKERERKYTVNVQCSVHYTLLLFYLVLVMSYSA
jgi:hypothetical protein